MGRSQETEATVGAGSVGTGDGSHGRETGPGDHEGRRGTRTRDDVDGELPDALTARVLLDLGLTKPPSPREELLAQLPPPEPGVKNMYGEYDGLAPVGYSDAYCNPVVIPLDRRKYAEFEDAEARVNELVKLRNLRLIGTPFHTARYWVFKAVPC